MALVITLIMLSVTLVMVVAFLAVSNRERKSVTTSADGTTARLAAETALAAAQSQLVANLLAAGNGNLNSRLIVSTNYINAYGYTPGFASPTNVNYDYKSDNTAFTADDRNQNIANLQFLPRAPVMMSTSTNDVNGRFYLDLNRNGAFEDTGDRQPNVLFVNNNTAVITNGVIDEIGDPQWVGILERPDTTHAADNKFLSRYAYIVLPVGNSLDINHIHNQVLNTALNNAQDGFFRNQGVGSWELNLAAFLADLNTNQWLPAFPPANLYYAYNRPLTGFANSGLAFDDARALLAWRYNYTTLASANAYLFNPANVFPYDNIDAYSDGPLQFTTTNIDESILANRDNPALSWAGADNPNRFFTPADFFDPAKSAGGINSFTNRLSLAGNTIAANGARPTYDRYTFYRMLDQLGTDSAPEDANKMNLNYDNLDAGGNVLPNAQTNLLAWAAEPFGALRFFTNAADRMLRQYTTNWFQNNPSNYLATYYGIHYTPYIDPATGYGFTNTLLGVNIIPAFGISEIPVYYSNEFVYSPAVNRVLQLAANIYDASTNEFFPSAFRPKFFKGSNGHVFIVGYDDVSQAAGTLAAGTPPLDEPIALNDLPVFTAGINTPKGNVFGIPWILGAKKNLPGFNQFVMRNDVSVTRKLQVTRSKVEAYAEVPTDTRGDFSTNQMIVMSITNHVGYAFWNSYSANYPGGDLRVFIKDIMGMSLTNAVLTRNLTKTNTANIFISSGTPWPGSAWDLTVNPGSRNAAPESFVHGQFDFAFLPESTYQYSPAAFIPTSSNPPFETGITSLPVFPQFGLLTTNQFQAFIIDTTANRLVDYVQFSGPDSSRDLNSEIKDNYTGNNPPFKMWYTNAYNQIANPPVPTLGVINQLYVSRTGTGAPNLNSWKAPPNMPPGLAQTPAAEAAFFDAFFKGPTYTFPGNGGVYSNTVKTNQAPYTPARTTYIYTIWQANDPLVHYLSTDLSEANSDTGLLHSDDPVNDALPFPSQNIVADRYQPWGRGEQMAGLNNVDHNLFNLAYRDPLVYGSDNWDFPTNKYPSIGWLGRVHRGTPWQTVYLKATNILSYSDKTIPADGFVTWTNWLGDADLFDAKNSAPSQDSRLFDIFSTALDENASRGTLSVNQTHVAAWSAVLAGVDVISNTTPDFPNYDQANYQTNLVIDPAGIDAANTPLWYMVNGPNGINVTRANTNLFPNQAFARVGDILRVSALTEQSPFINTNDASRLNYDISDEVYERIPQQVLGLLRVGAPRYVVYCYGQALRPASGGTVFSSSLLPSGFNPFGMVTNYQVAAESAARAVVSVQPKVVFTATGPVTNYTMKVESFNVLGPE